jgi:hypothetical protein
MVCDDFSSIELAPSRLLGMCEINNNGDSAKAFRNSDKPRRSASAAKTKYSQVALRLRIDTPLLRHTCTMRARTSASFAWNSHCLDLTLPKPHTALSNHPSGRERLRYRRRPGSNRYGSGAANAALRRQKSQREETGSCADQPTAFRTKCKWRAATSRNPHSAGFGDLIRLQRLGLTPGPLRTANSHRAGSSRSIDCCKRR